MSIEVMDVLQEKLKSAKEITEDAITDMLHVDFIVFVAVSMTALQLSLQSYTVFCSSSLIDTRDEQAEKQAFPIIE